MTARYPLLALALAAGIATSACHKQPAAPNSLDAMDNELIDGSATNEAARRALASAIQVDPSRTGRHQPGDRPATVRLAAVAERQARHEPVAPAGEDDGIGIPRNCLNNLAYANAWAAKLPADLPMHPAARLQEAAGHDGACAARIASFSVPGDRDAVLAWYEGKARAAGYSAERGSNGSDLTLQGGRKGGEAFIIMAGRATGGATPVDYVWTHKS